MVKDDGIEELNGDCLSLHSAIYPTLLGSIRIERSGEFITRLEILSGVGCDVRGEEVRDPLLHRAYEQVLEYLSGRRREFDLPLDLSSCTPFQRDVWMLLQSIPYGEVRTYKDIATMLGRPSASRAVGGACNRNPIHLAIPCHRVVGANGRLTGYAAGLNVKGRLLRLEGVRGCDLQ